MEASHTPYDDLKAELTKRNVFCEWVKLASSPGSIWPSGGHHLVSRDTVTACVFAIKSQKAYRRFIVMLNRELLGYGLAVPKEGRIIFSLSSCDLCWRGL